MILVTGAAGKTGKAVVKALAAKGANVRALIRRPEQAATLKALGAAEVSIGSFDDPRSLLLAAAGTRAIYHICPNVSRNELNFARAVTAAALAQNVKRFVYHSVLHPQIEAMPHHWAKMRAEEMLLAAGLDLTILQPTAYMQNLIGVWPGIVEDGVLRIPYPADTRLSLVDLDDVAEVAARVLTEGGHVGATYELVGTTPLSQTEIATAIGAVLNRDISVEAESVETWEARARASEMGEHQRVTLAAMFRYYAQHGLIGNPQTLRWLLGRAPNNLAHFVAVRDNSLTTRQSLTGRRRS
jgi:NAD(P)H dehydrogenase (quinone)